jgi:hypothetical protein
VDTSNVIATNCIGKSNTFSCEHYLQIIQVTYRETTKKYKHASKYHKEGRPKTQVLNSLITLRQTGETQFQSQLNASKKYLLSVIRRPSTVRLNSITVPCNIAVKLV